MMAFTNTNLKIQKMAIDLSIAIFDFYKDYSFNFKSFGLINEERFTNTKFISQAQRTGITTKAKIIRRTSIEPLECWYAVRGPINPENPKPAEKGVPFIFKTVAKKPEIPEAIITGMNNLGFSSILAI